MESGVLLWSWSRPQQSITTLRNGQRSGGDTQTDKSKIESKRRETQQPFKTRIEHANKAAVITRNKQQVGGTQKTTKATKTKLIQKESEKQTARAAR